MGKYDPKLYYDNDFVMKSRYYLLDSERDRVSKERDSYDLENQTGVREKHPISFSL